MKNIERFYLKVLTYLKSQPESDDLVRQEILELASECKDLSWEATDEELKKLDQCVNRSEEVSDSEEWSEPREEFVLAAFKDLSPIKGELGMTIFRDLQRTCLFEIAEHLLWARKIVKRDDGTAIIVLHVSNLKRFESLVGGPRIDVIRGDLESGLMIGF